MKTYASQIIYTINCDGRFTGQYEEQWRLVYAEDEEDAIKKAKEIGAEEASMLVDRHGRTMSWEMIAIKDIKLLELGDGAILTSTIVDVTTIPAPIWEDHTMN